MSVEIIINELATLRPSWQYKKTTISAFADELALGSIQPSSSVKFSQRKGLTSVRVDLQRETIDEPLRNKLWSALQIAVFSYGVVPDAEMISSRTWIHYFKWPLDEKPRGALAGIAERMRPWFFAAPWYDVYDFIEFLVGELEGQYRQQLVDLVNAFLESEMSAYRVVGTEIGDITDEQEIAAIEAAQVDATGLAGVQTHLRDALAKLTDRRAPDYRNSIKESISAVEAMCQALTADASATLGQAIKRLKDSGILLHPALEQSWSRMYGYTSDASGIRHALSDEPNVSFGDAKYMLVTCSAFISYLADAASRAGITLSKPT